VFIPERARGPRSGRSYRAARGRSASSLLALPVVQPDPAGEKVTTAFLPQSADHRTDDWGATSWHRAQSSQRVDPAATRAAKTERGGIRLTRRGVITVVSAVVLASCLMGGIAWASAPPTAVGGADTPATVTVRPGDTLWSIALRSAPNRDPRAEVDQISSLNHLADGQTLSPGQVLRTR